MQSNCAENINSRERKNFIKPYENYERLNDIKNKAGIHSRMYNELIVPDETDMIKFIEDEEVLKLWKNFIGYIDNNYMLDKSIHYGGKNYGWEVLYKHGKKSIVSINPERNAFTILYIYTVVKN